MWKLAFFITLGVLLILTIILSTILYRGWVKTQRFTKAFYVKPYMVYNKQKYDLLPLSEYFGNEQKTVLSPMSMDFNKNTLRVCIDLFYRTYDYYYYNNVEINKVKDLFTFMNLDKIYATENADTVILVQKDMVNNFRRVWIMNRGISSKDELIDLLTNFYTNDMNLTVKPKARPRLEARLATAIDVLEGETDNTFEGIQSRAIDIYNKASFHIINQLLEEYTLTSKDQIIIAGHSFGGALALVIYRRLLENYKDIMVCYTFNSIKVGNRIFRKSIPTERVFRIFNTEDIVPSLPFASFYNWNLDKYENYYHVGQNYAFTDNSGSGSFNHTIDIVKLNQDNLVYIPDQTLN